jgi:LmbE family N-acetylglucosaminyl deacetylase
MKLCRKNADIFVPDKSNLKSALGRTTHMGVGAHQDDLEVMAAHGILECFGRKDKWFTGIACTDGAGSSRTGAYAGYTDTEMKRVRLEEQRAAARIGLYSAVIQLGYTSKETRNRDTNLEDDLLKCFKAAHPRVVYTHNPADKHPTHVATSLAVIGALRRLPPALKPKNVYGAEVWRSLDWLPDDRKVLLDLSGRENLLAALMGVFKSQIAGGKRYDLASLGRWRANATYLESHAVDKFELVEFALDLTPLVLDEKADVVEYVGKFVDKFNGDVRGMLRSLSKRK